MKMYDNLLDRRAGQKEECVRLGRSTGMFDEGLYVQCREVNVSGDLMCRDREY